MARKPRCIRQGEFYHILCRGNDRKELFKAQGDFSFFLIALSRYSSRSSVSIYHYCLMTNHAHFLMKCDNSDEGITHLMHDLQTAYAVYFQKRYGRTGHVFENRFKDHLIEDEAYLLECGRYIERNPVRAGMVREAHEYEWSSFRYYASGERGRFSITENPMYESLGRTPEERREKYCGYVGEQRAYEKIVDKFFDEHVLV